MNQRHDGYVKRWQYVLGFLFAIFLGMIGFFVYNKINLNFINTKELQLNDVIKQKEGEMAKANLLDAYNRYKYSKILLDKDFQVKRGNNISKVIEMFDTLKGISTEEISLSDFTIGLDKISLKGQTSDMKYVYANGGLIDKFSNLPFVENMNIQNYTKDGNNYKFTLSANVKIDGNQK